MKNKIALLALLVIQNFLYSQENWELTKETEGIKVYTKKENDHKFETFKANVIINSSIHHFISILSNIEKLPNWGYKVKEANLLERSGDTLQIYYSVAKAPFPYKDRDGVYLNRFRWQSKTKTLMVDIEILENYLDQNEKYVRVKGNGYWKVKELPNNKIHVTFSMQIDPGGSISAWLANMFVEDTPFNTLFNLKTVLESDDFVKHTYDFID